MQDMQQHEAHDGKMSEQITVMMMPVSLRTFDGELEYQEAKKNGLTMPLELEPSMKEWDHWRLIDNRFPYAVGFKSHHMLITKRANVFERWDLNDDERREFEQILKDFVYPRYDLWFENSPKRRSMKLFYHVHVAAYHDERSAMQL